MTNPNARPHGASLEQWGRHWETMRGQALILVDNAFNGVAADLAAGDRRAAAVVAKFEADQSQAVDGIADALYTLLAAHVHKVLAVTVSGIPSRSQATCQRAHTLVEVESR